VPASTPSSISTIPSTTCSACGPSRVRAHLVVSPYGFVAGRDALIKMYASFMKPGDKEVDTATSARMIGDGALCTGGFTFTPASATSGEKGFWTKVVGKVGGEWKILNLTYATAAPQ
jgi:hypothetical protein